MSNLLKQTPLATAVKYVTMCAATTALVTAASLAQAIEFKASGQVSRMIVAPDDAVGDEIQFQDIGWSGSRFRFTGSQELDNGMEVGFRLEQQFQANASSYTSGGDHVKNTADKTDNRYQDIYFSGGFGKVAIGKGDGAGNGGTEVDLSGTALSSSSNHQDNWGNYRITPTQTWDSIFTMQDSLSRTNRLRYDSPAFGAFSFAASIGQGSATELAVRYSGNWGDTKFKAAAFVADTADLGGLGTDTDIIGGSASLLLGGGINITIAFSDVDPTGGLERDAQTIKLGYKRGIHAYAIDFGEGTTGSEDADTVGLTYAAHVYKGIEIFGTYRQLDSDKVAGAQSIDIFAFGSRVKF